MEQVPPLLKWIGNKQRFAETITSFFPSSFNDYYEPFLGSGAVMAHLLFKARKNGAPSFNHVYGSDILPFLIELFHIVQDEPNRLTAHYEKEILEYYLNPEAKYNEIQGRFNKTHNPLDFCLLSRTCYGGIIRFRKTDGYMSTPKGPHKPISPSSFEQRVSIWHSLVSKVEFAVNTYEIVMDNAKAGDVVYCDPPYTHSQSIIYGSQTFSIEQLFEKIKRCKDRGVFVLLSLNGSRESNKKDISITPPSGLFERSVTINCGTSMIDRLQSAGFSMENEVVYDKLLLTW